MNDTIRYSIRPYDTLWMLAQVFNTTVDSLMELNPGMEPTNLQIGQVITIKPGYQYYPGYPEDMPGDGNNAVSSKLMDLVNYFRMLWEEHITWTGIVIDGILNDLPDTDVSTQRLLRNPVDFANAFAPFYGEEFARAFSDLLTGHLTIAADLVKAVKAGDTNAASEIEGRWYDNADQIAELLSSVNPYWSTEDWQAMLHEHLDLLKSNINDRINQNFTEAVNTFDAMEQQALEMADMMAEGIYMQFPA